ncbi:Lipid A biosynthesis lauroyl acyltransferase [Granulibacter bethesdensis]|nr:Lipid A biosynthesis lauroyl acyltransferase [Granulibacter bethesdensis]
MTVFLRLLFDSRTILPRYWHEPLLMKVCHAIQGQALRLVLALLKALGAERASDLGGAVARRIGPYLPVSRVADRNLRLAMPELDAAARRRIIGGVWDNLGRTVAEYPHLPLLKRTQSGPGWEIEGEEILLAQAARGGACIFVSGHIGNWEVLPPAVATFGMFMSSIYRAPANPVVDKILLSLRRRAIGAEIPLFPKGAVGARYSVAHLRAGGCLGMLIDQKMNDGIESSLFGYPAMTAPAAAALALKFNCPVIPGYMRRIGPARFRLIVEPPLSLPETGQRAEDIAALTLAMNQVLERWIRAVPEQWLWLHRRWPKPVMAAVEDRITGEA